MGIEREVYKQALKHACTKALFEIDAVLSGKAEGSRYQLAAEQYAQARQHFAHLYMIVCRPRLEQTPISRARDDVPFQRFLTGITRRRRRRPQNMTAVRGQASAVKRGSPSSGRVAE